MDRSKRNQFATLALGALVAVAQPSFARAGSSPDTHEDRKEARGGHLGEFKGLNLTDAQKAQVKSIFATSSQQRDAPRL